MFPASLRQLNAWLTIDRRCAPEIRAAPETQPIILQTKRSLKAELTRQELLMALVNAGDRPRLSGLDLNELDLAEVDLRSANLCNTQLGRADLRLADLAEADLTGAVWLCQKVISPLKIPVRQ